MRDGNLHIFLMLFIFYVETRSLFQELEFAPRLQRVLSTSVPSSRFACLVKIFNITGPDSLPHQHHLKIYAFSHHHLYGLSHYLGLIHSFTLRSVRAPSNLQ